MTRLCAIRETFFKSETFQRQLGVIRNHEQPILVVARDCHARSRGWLDGQAAILWDHYSCRQGVRSAGDSQYAAGAGSLDVIIAEGVA